MLKYQEGRCEDRHMGCSHMIPEGNSEQVLQWKRCSCLLVNSDSVCFSQYLVTVPVRLISNFKKLLLLSSKSVMFKISKNVVIVTATVESL